MAQKQKSKGGRNKVKCQKYRLRNNREKNKLVRILHSNGYVDAFNWAKASGMQDILARIIKAKVLHGHGQFLA